VQAGQITRADPLVDSHDVAFAQRHQPRGRLHRVQQVPARAHCGGERIEIVVELACRDRVEQHALGREL
jgi:hypothetical protein